MALAPFVDDGVAPGLFLVADVIAVIAVTAIQAVFDPRAYQEAWRNEVGKAHHEQIREGSNPLTHPHRSCG